MLMATIAFISMLSHRDNAHCRELQGIQEQAAKLAAVYTGMQSDREKLNASTVSQQQHAAGGVITELLDTLGKGDVAAAIEQLKAIHTAGGHNKAKSASTSPVPDTVEHEEHKANSSSVSPAPVPVSDFAAAAAPRPGGAEVQVKTKPAGNYTPTPGHTDLGVKGHHNGGAAKTQRTVRKSNNSVAGSSTFRLKDPVPSAGGRGPSPPAFKRSNHFALADRRLGIRKAERRRRGFNIINKFKQNIVIAIPPPANMSISPRPNQLQPPPQAQAPILSPKATKRTVQPLPRKTILRLISEYYRELSYIHKSPGAPQPIILSSHVSTELANKYGLKSVADNKFLQVCTHIELR